MQPDDAPALRETAAFFARYPAPWWVAGGWAVDLNLGRTTRPHSDVDVMVRAADLPTLAATFADGGLVVHNHATSERFPWDGKALLEAGRDTVAIVDAPHETEALLALTDGDDWVFHRGSRPHRPWAAITRLSPAGIPYLSADVLLLFKARNHRPKDDEDFEALAPLLTHEQRGWLAPRLTPPNGPTHPWQARLAG